MMRLLNWLSNNWNRPAHGIIAITGAIFSFFAPPGRNIAIGNADTILELSRTFIIPVVWLILSVPARRYKARVHATRWVWVSVPALIFALSVWIVQSVLYQSWTCYSPVHKQRFTFGETFTREAIEGRRDLEVKLSDREISNDEALELLRATSPCSLIDGAVSGSEGIWESREISQRRLAISVLYVVGLPIFVITLIAALQGAYCAGRRR